MRLLIPLLLACGAACSGPALLAVDPAQVAAGGVVNVEGQGFDDTLALHLEGAGSISLTLTDVTPTSARAALPNNTPGGVYDVVAVTAAGEARLVGGLTVLAGQLEAFFVDVGQGDATLLVAPDGTTLLLDGGPPEATDAVRQLVDDAVGGRLDMVAVSHTHADHLGGIVGLLRGPDGRAGSDDDIVPALRWIGHDDDVCDSQLCDSYRALRGAPFDKPAVGTVLPFGGATITVLARDGDAGNGLFADVDDPNEMSLALLVEFGGRKLFLGGDVTGGGIDTVDIEAAIALVTGPVDVVHLNHHGSRTSSSPGFLQALQPRAVIVSVGTDNSFCHPDDSVLERLQELDIPAFATGAGMVDDVGDCDGPTVWPTSARPALGTFSLVIEADGDLTLAGVSL